jgi:2-amino-4-hydroxy-6-hydroxymethyldihydropteridine diphosphokinase
MTTAVLGLGTAAQPHGMSVLQDAIEMCRRQMRVVGVSGFHHTLPFGGQTTAPFSNAALVVETTQPLAALWQTCCALEHHAGRVRGARIERNAPRLLDVDVLCVLDQHRSLSLLSLPHPRVHERRFALVPAREALLDAGVAFPFWLESTLCRVCVSPQPLTA